MSVSTGRPNLNWLSMSNDDRTEVQRSRSRVDIWGSCVSRDTMEYVRSYSVGEYVARQSAIVSLAPAPHLAVPVERLESDFQRRMLVGDMKSNVAERIDESESKCVLLDLVDERRGVWRFPDGSFLTNSVEAFRTKIDDWAPAMGARHIKFGTDEHYNLWVEGFTSIARSIRRSGKPMVFLDVAWAEVFEGQRAPQGPLSVLGSAFRKSKSKISSGLHAAQRDRSLWSGISNLRNSPVPPGDEHVRIVRDANSSYKRYAEYAESLSSITIKRSRKEVRMGRHHRWGAGPYHYSDADYESIGQEICKVLTGYSV